MPSDLYTITDTVSVSLNPPNFATTDSYSISDAVSVFLSLQGTAAPTDSLFSFSDQVNLSLNLSNNTYYRRYLNDVKR